MIGWRKKNTAPRFYILPTKEGLFSFLVLGVMTLISLNYTNNLAFLLTFMLLSMLIISTVFTHKNIATLKFGAFSATPVFSGEDAIFRCAVTTGKDFHRQVTLQLQGGESQTINLNPHSQTVELTVKTTVRGDLKVQKLLLSTTFPFGLFVAWSEIPIDANVLVYPKPLRKSLEILETEGDGDAENSRPSAPGCDDFEGVRSYAPGDSMRRIDWRAYSRTGELLTKLFSKDSGEILTLDLSAVRSSELEERLSIIVYWVVNYSKKGVPFALKIPGITFAPASGEKHLHECLKVLARYPRAT